MFDYRRKFGSVVGTGLLAVRCILIAWGLTWVISISFSVLGLCGVVPGGYGGYHSDGPTAITELTPLPLGWNKIEISGGKTRYIRTEDLDGLDVGDSTNKCDGHYESFELSRVICYLPFFWRLPPYIDAMLSGEDRIVIVNMR